MESSSSDSDRIDRISNLPDEVLHTILSSFRIFELVRLGVLSKRWNRIWRTTPYLNFDFCCREMIINLTFTRSLIDKFREFIDSLLNSQSATQLVRFRLRSAYLFDVTTIYRWIHSAAMRNVQEIELNFSPRGPFELPVCISACKSLQVFKLKLSFRIINLPNDQGFCQLKLLELHDVDLSNGLLTSCLSSKCPLLETLTLYDCCIENTVVLDISSMSLVNVFITDTISNDESYSYFNIKISCPNLKVLQYGAPVPKHIIMENLFSIEDVKLFFALPYPQEYYIQGKEAGVIVHRMIRSVSCVSVLKLCRSSIRSLYTLIPDTQDYPLLLCKLKFLELELEVGEISMQVMMLLLKYSPNLEGLELGTYIDGARCKSWRYHDPDEKIVCLESHLKVVKFTNNGNKLVQKST